MLLGCKNYFVSQYITFKLIPFTLNFSNCVGLFNKLTLMSSLKKNMEISDLLSPPKTVNKMKILNRDAFNREITVSCLEVEKQHVKKLQKVLKPYLLTKLRIKPLPSLEDSSKLKIVVNPNFIKSFNDFDEDSKKILNAMAITEKNFSKTILILKYENWSAKTLLKAVLPENEPPLTSYSIIGHIIHLNIKEHLLDYKHIIGEILLDKNFYAKTVVFKKNVINNLFRNFEMEVICGEPNFMVSTIEYGVKFEFDFSKVYWNPRLSTEHNRIVQLLEPGDVLFDVFAGVGPFSIRAAKKKCFVFSNDLNPDSYFWLNHNIQLNLKAKEYIKTYNKDAADFLLNDAKVNLLKFWNDEGFNNKIYFVMNLPATALQFLKFFKGLFTERDLIGIDTSKIEKCLPIIHCHYFVKEPETEYEVFKRDSGISFHLDEESFHFVRLVSNKKKMMRTTFKLPLHYLLQEYSEINGPPTKKHCN